MGEENRYSVRMYDSRRDAEAQSFFLVTTLRVE